MTKQAGLPEGLKQSVEALSGLSLDGVRVHRDSDKPGDLHAATFAQGQDIHLNPGRQRPLPQAAWHVVQQKQGRVRPTPRIEGTSIDDDASLEQEADRLGAAAVAKAPPARP